jgi:predicted PurR-regulated permease PerM
MSSPSSVLGANRQTVFRAFFFSVFLFLLYQFILILSPFVTPLVVSTTLTLIFYPLHARISRRLKNRPNAAAGVSVALIMVIVIVPTILLAWLLIKESRVVSPSARQWVQNVRTQSFDTSSFPPATQKILRKAEALLGSWEIDLQDIFLKNLDQIGGQISAFGGRVLKNVVFLVFDVLVTAFTLFFFFRDGEKIVRRIMDLVPMEHDHKEHILKRLDQTLSAVVRGVFITATVQGGLAGIAYTLAGLNFSVLLTFATAFMALIPFAGAASVWIPVSVYMFLKGATVKAIFLFCWGILVVSLVDNILRPILIGEKAKLPILLLFFGILGGLQVYGFIGILIGPLMIASVLAFAKIYREQMPKHADKKTDLPPSLPLSA